MKPHDAYKWGVHIYGPDSFAAAKDFGEATEKAHEINMGFYVDKPDHMAAFYPVVVAVVFIWDEDLHGTHDPENTDWSDIG